MGALVRGICFHGIGEPRRTLEPGEDSYWVGADDYPRILDELMTWPQVSITFDDGNVSDVEHGLPALRERGLTATFFVLGGRIGSPGSLGADDLAELASAGMTVGSHGMDHRPWRGLSPTDLSRELVDARELIAAAAGAPITEAACPLGRYDRHVLGELRRAGYERVHTSDRRPARAEAWLQPRFSVHRGETSESLRVSLAAAETPKNRTVRGAIGLVKRVR